MADRSRTRPTNFAKVRKSDREVRCSRATIANEIRLKFFAGNTGRVEIVSYAEIIDVRTVASYTVRRGRYGVHRRVTRSISFGVKSMERSVLINSWATLLQMALLHRVSPIVKTSARDRFHQRA